MAKEIKTPADFETTRLVGEDFDRYIIPAKDFVDIIKGKYFYNFFWEDFKGEDSVGNKYILLKDNFIINDIVEIGNDIFPHTVIITGGIFESRLIVKSGTYKGNFQFLSGKYDDGILIDGGIFEANFIISGGLYKSVFINGGQFQTFSIRGGIFMDTVNIRQGTFITYFTINNGIFTNLNIVGGTYEGLFAIQGGVFNNINISDTLTKSLSLNKVSISDCSVLNNLIIRSKSPIEVLVGVQYHNVSSRIDTMINTIKIELENKSTVKFRHTHINSILFDNIILNKDTILNIENCTTNQLSFIGLYNYGYANISDIAIANNQTTVFDINSRQSIIVTEKLIPNKLSIINCDLGRIQFINCDFSLIDQFNFVSSKITDIFIAGTSFPSKITTSDFSQQRLGYGQLKKVYENRGDLIEARKYYAKEMIAYWQTIKWYNIGEHILLFFNAISNGFSRFWLLGVGFTAAITYIFFYAYSQSLGLEWISIIDWSQGNDIPHEAGRIFVFFQPWHKPDEVFKGIENTNWSLFWDFIGRLFIAFGIYQTIAAFRKHGRSGS